MQIEWVIILFLAGLVVHFAMDAYNKQGIIDHLDYELKYALQQNLILYRSATQEVRNQLTALEHDH